MYGSPLPLTQILARAPRGYVICRAQHVYQTCDSTASRRCLFFVRFSPPCLYSNPCQRAPRLRNLSCAARLPRRASAPSEAANIIPSALYSLPAFSQYHQPARPAVTQKDGRAQASFPWSEATPRRDIARHAPNHCLSPSPCRSRPAVTQKDGRAQASFPWSEATPGGIGLCAGYELGPSRTVSSFAPAVWHETDSQRFSSLQHLQNIYFYFVPTKEKMLLGSFEGKTAEEAKHSARSNGGPSGGRFAHMFAPLHGMRAAQDKRRCLETRLQYHIQLFHNDD